MDSLGALEGISLAKSNISERGACLLVKTNRVMPAFIHNRSGHFRIGKEHRFLNGLRESVDNPLKTVKGTVKCAQVAILPLPRRTMQWKENKTPIQCVCNDR